MEAVKVIEDVQKLEKGDFEGYLKGAKAKQLLDELWPFIKLDENGRILYIGENGKYIPGSPLVELIQYTTATKRSTLDRPFDIEKFWSFLAANGRVGDKMWTKLGQ